MAENNRIYVAIDLKSFYASAECVERGLDPLTTNLIVADASRTEKTICLAVSPALKEYGIPGRPRLFEVVGRVSEINEKRRQLAPGKRLTGKSYISTDLKRDPTLSLDYITAPPRMAHYMRFSTQIYGIYLRRIAPEDIHVYSIDEVFIDMTDYLKTYKMTPRELAMTLVSEVLSETGITATAGIGTNMYLAKIAMDIVAKHMTPDPDGVRIAELDEMSYRRMLWSHRPITDFWRIGRGYANRLEKLGLYTMGDIARCSVGDKSDFYNEELLYKTFGINAELIIDHAWGWEPCTISDIKAYKPRSNSIGAGQVLQCAYDHEKAGLIVKEMADLLALDLVDKGLLTKQIVITAEYDKDNMKNGYKGDVSIDRYGRRIPKHAHGTIRLEHMTSSSSIIIKAASELYERITDKSLLIRKIYITAENVIPYTVEAQKPFYEQLDLFTDQKKLEEERQARKKAAERERSLQKTILDMKKKFGKNAIVKGMNLEEGATTISRNKQIGGHKA